MNLLYSFLCGFAGSAAVEIIVLHQVYQTVGAKKPTLPARYKTVGFWIMRILVAVIAGGLALAYRSVSPISPLLAVNIGASAPSIILTLSQGYKK